MRDSCDLCNLTTGPVVKLHANTFKLIQNDTHLLDNVSGLSLLLIYLSNKRWAQWALSRIWHFMWHNRGQKHENWFFFFFLTLSSKNFVKIQFDWNIRKKIWIFLSRSRGATRQARALQVPSSYKRWEIWREAHVPLLSLVLICRQWPATWSPVLPGIPFRYENRSGRQHCSSHSFPTACLRSWLKFNSAGMLAVELCDGSSYRRRMFSFVPEVRVPGFTGGYVADTSAAYENQALLLTGCIIFLTCEKKSLVILIGC